MIEKVKELLARDEMGYSERFEADAERFYRETGFMAPGKSVPFEMAAQQRLEDREEAWSKWSQKRREEFRELLRGIIAALSGYASTPLSEEKKEARVARVVEHADSTQQATASKERS